MTVCIEKHLAYRTMVLHGSRMQWSESTARGGVDVEATADKERGGFLQAFQGRDVKEC